MAPTALVPTMTSSSTPSGEVTQDSNYDANYVGWKAFDGNPSTYWFSQLGKSDNWVCYRFTAPVNVVKAVATIEKYGSPASIPTYIEGSNDGTNFTPISEETVTVDSTRDYEYNCDGGNAYTYIRWHTSGSMVPSTNNSFLIYTLQFYGYE